MVLKNTLGAFKSAECPPIFNIGGKYLTNMSFFDQPKNAGLAMIIVAIVNILAAIANIVVAATAEEGVDYSGIIVAVGLVITGIIYFKFGSNVRAGNISKKIDILASFVNVVGINTIVTGVFAILSGTFASGVWDIIFGIIICFCGKKINDGKETTLDKILWIVLLVIFVLSILFSIVELVAFPIGTLLGICGIIIYVFMTLLILDGEVKKAMGM